MKRFDIVTIFPGIFDSYFGESIIKRAREGGFIDINVHNLRDFTTDKHRTVDDTPYGGGAGMVLKIEPIYKAVQDIKKSRHPEFISGSQLESEKILKQVQNDSEKTRIILFSAKGKRFTQADAKRLAEYDNLIMVCGRYEGVDERVAENIIDEELSIGDYVLTGGEIPAMVVVDSVTRLIPGVLGNADSAVTESHSEEGYLEYPQYTKPEKFFPEGESASGGQDWKVPEVLLSGNHAEIEKWRKSRSGKNQ